MIAALRTPASRISLAIALSAMVHAAVLWLPHLQLPHKDVHLPPLTARLESRPLAVTQPAAAPEPLNQTGKPTSNATNTMKKMEKSAAPHLFPRHVQLAFVAYRNADSFRIGELHHQLDIDRDRYTLKSVKQTAGLTSLLSSDQTIQTSHGKIGEHGLQPETFREEKITAGSKQNLKATFDWAAQNLHFSHGGDTALPADAQDILSFMYQFSQLPMNKEFFTLPISAGTQLEQWRIEIVRDEDIATPMGKLHALHLRKMHAQGEVYFEIWLGLEYRLLPVKIRQVDGSGDVTEEFVISDIRAADE